MNGKKCSFIMVPYKIYDLNLDVYEIALFVALKSHADKDGSKIFPGQTRLRKMLGGISKDRLWKSLHVLKGCNIIQWDSGSPGKSNQYVILGQGVWSKKIVDNSKLTCPPGRQGVSARKTGGCPPGGTYLDPLTRDNNYNGGFINIVDNLRKKQKDKDL